jgi:hypothetical protein
MGAGVVGASVLGVGVVGANVLGVGVVGDITRTVWLAAEDEGGGSAGIGRGELAAAS